MTTLFFAALVSLSTAFAGTGSTDRDASDNLLISLDAADPKGAWTLLPVELDPEPAAARAKADILVDSLSGISVAWIEDATVLRDRPLAIVSSTGQALVGIDPDEIDFDGAVEGIDPDEIDYDGALKGIDPDEIDVYALLRSGLDLLVVNPDGSPAALLVSMAD